MTIQSLLFWIIPKKVKEECDKMIECIHYLFPIVITKLENYFLILQIFFTNFIKTFH